MDKILLNYHERQKVFLFLSSFFNSLDVVFQLLCPFLYYYYHHTLLFSSMHSQIESLTIILKQPSFKKFKRAVDLIYLREIYYKTNNFLSTFSINFARANVYSDISLLLLFGFHKRTIEKAFKLDSFLVDLGNNMGFCALYESSTNSTYVAC